MVESVYEWIGKGGFGERNTLNEIWSRSDFFPLVCQGLEYV